MIGQWLIFFKHMMLLNLNVNLFNNFAMGFYVHFCYID